MPDQTPASPTDEHLQIVADASHPDCHPDGQVRDMAAELLAARTRVTQLEASVDTFVRMATRGGETTEKICALVGADPEDAGMVPAVVDRVVAEHLTLRKRLDRVTDLFEKWAAEESEHRAAGEYGIAEGFRVAIEELREAVHGTFEPIGGAR